MTDYKPEPEKWETVAGSLAIYCPAQDGFHRTVPNSDEETQFILKACQEYEGLKETAKMQDQAAQKIQAHVLKLERDNKAMLEALKDLAEYHDGKCDSCGCEIAKEGYCGCLPLPDSVMNDRRCKARVVIAKAEGGE